MTEEKKNVPELRFPEFKNEWRIITLGEATIKIGSGKTPLGGSSVYLNNGIPFLRSQNVQYGILDLSELVYIDENTDENMKNSRTYYGDILLNITGASIGRSTVNTIKEGYANLNQHVCIIRLKEHYNYNFIGQFLISPKGQKRIFMAQSGGSREGLNFNEISKIKFNLPDEVEEQQKIGDFFSKLDRQIELEEQKLALLEDQKKGYMQKIFSQELRFKDENGEDYPAWEERKLEDIANYRRGSFPQPYGNKEWYDEENGEPFVQVYDVDSNMKLNRQTKQKISQIAKPKSVKGIKGNIVITLQGSIGRVAVLQYDAYIDRTLLLINSYKKPVNTDYIKYVLYLLFLREKERAPGGTIKTITKNVLSNFKIKLPILEEQQKIGDFFSKLDQQIELQGQKIESLKQRKKGLLQKMFV